MRPIVTATNETGGDARLRGTPSHPIPFTQERMIGADELHYALGEAPASSKSADEHVLARYLHLLPQRRFENDALILYGRLLMDGDYVYMEAYFGELIRRARHDPSILEKAHVRECCLSTQVGLDRIREMSARGWSFVRYTGRWRSLARPVRKPNARINELVTLLDRLNMPYRQSPPLVRRAPRSKMVSRRKLRRLLQLEHWPASAFGALGEEVHDLDRSPRLRELLSKLAA